MIIAVVIDLSSWEAKSVDASVVWKSSPPSEIVDWIDEPDRPLFRDNVLVRLDAKREQSAMCPKCGIDSVIGSNSGYPITTEFLTRMKERWF
jgi:hypothetical protein